MTTPKARFEIVADDKTAAAFKSALTSGQKFGNQLSGVLKASFAGLSVGAIGSAINKAIQYGDELGKLSAKSGLSTAAAAELSYAFQQNDLDMQMLSTSMKKMQTEISKGNDIFKQLGLSLDDLKAQAPDRQFETLAQRISELKDPADRTRAAVEVFGRAGADLLPLFEKGAAGIRAAREEAVRLGHTMSEEAVKSLQEGDKAIKQLEATWNSFIRSVAVGTVKIGQAFDVVDRDQVGELEEQLKALNFEKMQLETGNEGGLFDKQRWTNLNQSIEETRARLENARIAQLLAEAGQSAGGHGAIKSTGGSGELVDDKKNDTKGLEEIRVSAKKINLGPDIEQWANDQIDMVNDVNAAWEDLKLGVPDAAEKMADEAITELDRTNEALRKSADESNVYMEQMHDSLYRSFHDLFMDIGTGADNFAKSILNTFKSLLADVATKQLFEAFGTLGTANSGSWWGSLLTGLFSAKGNAFGRSGLLTAFASGGIVSGATPFAYAGGLGVMGEAGDEAIMPLSRGSDGKLGVKSQGGGTTTIAPTYNINITGEGVTRAQVAAALKQTHDATVATMQDMKRRGKF